MIKKLTILVLLITLLGGFTFATASSPLHPESVDQVSDSVSISPNNDYSYYENRDLVIDLSASNPNVEGDGVNANGVTTIPKIFNITYNGTEYAHVWIEYDHDAVTFTANGQPIHNESNNVTLAPGAESVPVGIRIDTTQDVSDTGVITEDDFTIHAKVAEPPEESGGSSAGTSSSAGTTSTVVSSPSATERSITASNLQAGIVEFIDLDGMIVSDSVTLESLAVERASFGDVDVSLMGSPGAPESGADVLAATGDVPLGYVAVESDHSDDEIEQATFTFTVDREALAARGGEPADLRVYRYDGTSFSTTEMEVVETTEESVRITAESSGFSVFAVALRGPAVTVTEASLSATEAETDETTTVTATVENAGGTDGETSVRLYANGDPIESKRVAVESGSTETVTFDVAFDDPGQYDLVVGNTTAGTLSVTAAEEPESTATSTTEAESTESTEPPSTAAATTTASGAAPVEEPGGFGVRELLGVFALLAMVLITLTLVRRVPR